MGRGAGGGPWKAGKEKDSSVDSEESKRRVIAVIPFLLLLSDADRRSGRPAVTVAEQVGGGGVGTGQERTRIWTDKHEHV